MIPYYQDDFVTIYHGDAEDVMATLPSESIDVVFTSPPYNRGDMAGGHANLQGGYRTHHDQMPHDEYVAWQHRALRECWRLLTATGAIFYNHKPRIQDGVAWLPLELNPGLPLRQVIIWDRMFGANWAPTHYMPVSEWILLFARPGFRLSSRSASHAGDVWRVAVEGAGHRPDHPAAFPLALPRIALSALDIGAVLDPFCGSGTTLMAAKSLGRKSIGIELDEAYCEVAATRCSQEVLGLTG